MLRLGLCCAFIQAPIRFRITTAKYTKTHGQEHLLSLIEENLDSLLQAVVFCFEHHIGSFRINSQLFPLYTHPECGYTLDDLPNRAAVYKKLDTVRLAAKEKNIRLTFHPDQFVVLNSPVADIVDRSLQDLEYHGVLAERLGADIINIHGGGGYGDKQASLGRFIKNFSRLSSSVQKRLTLENDDKIFTPEDLLPVCHTLNIPLTYDVHHHRCLPDSFSIEQATEKALNTWSREPLFHISSPKTPEKPKLHHDFINPADFPLCWHHIDPLTIDIEAKAKELAVAKLQADLAKKTDAL